MTLSEQDVSLLLQLMFAVNVLTVLVSLFLYDSLSWLFSMIAGRLSPKTQGCTPAGGVGDELPDDNSTLGAVSTPAVSCRAAGLNSQPARSSVRYFIDSRYFDEPVDVGVSNEPHRVIGTAPDGVCPVCHVEALSFVPRTALFPHYWQCDACYQTFTPCKEAS